MRKHMLNQWLDNLDSLFTTYADVARLGGELLERSQRSRSDALRLFFELGNRQLGQFWSWYYPEAFNPRSRSRHHPAGIALAVGLDDETLTTLRPLLAGQGQRLVIIEPNNGLPPVSPDYDADRLQCDIGSYSACNTLLNGIEQYFGPVVLLIKQSIAIPGREPANGAVLDNELDCIYNLTRHLIPGMLDRGYGRIILLKPKSYADQLPRAQHASICGFVRSLAREVSRAGIMVEYMSREQLTDLDDLGSADMPLFPVPYDDDPADDSLGLPVPSLTR